MTTQGYLSDGNSHKISISGSGGNDFFDVLRNKDILDLNGEAGDDTFVVRSFIALEIDEDGSTSNPELGDLGIYGEDGDDLVQVLGDFSTKQDDPDYVVNSLVDIDGGTGDDRLIVVGTEGDDSYVVADGNVYGGGCPSTSGPSKGSNCLLRKAMIWFLFCLPARTSALPSMGLWDPTLPFYVHAKWNQWFPRIAGVTGASLNTVSQVTMSDTILS